MLGVVSNNVTNRVYRFATKLSDRVHLESVLRPSNINLSSSEHYNSYFCFLASSKVVGWRFIQLAQSQKYVKFSVKNKNLMFMKSKPPHG